MNKIYCSQKHENPTGSRFCLQCGEQLVETSINSGVQPGLTLGDRYIVIRQIGQGGFGRTYLAEDINRFRETCVLKEFFPQVQTEYVIQKSEELFGREATVLYKLKHPQIPSFRELLRTNIQGKEHLFLVQDYVEGQTYSSLLETRQQQGLKFTELEIRQLLQQILPVLEYIHSLGVIHRDISPDNLMLRTADQLPVLIDFGGVKQVAATVVSQYYQSGSSPSVTLLGKIGFAPPEQMQTGSVYPHSDLYALAVTALVLLTGKQPEDLIDPHTVTWEWRREVNLSPAFAQVIEKMLSPLPGNRYQSARQVSEALNPRSLNYPPTQVPRTVAPPSGTVAIASPQTPALQNLTPPVPQQSKWWIPMVVILGIAAIAGILWKSIHKEVISPNVVETPIATTSSSPAPTEIATPMVEYSPEEKQRKQELSERRDKLGIDPDFYRSLVNQVFWDNNPSLKNHKLSNGPEDASLREEWDKTAAQLLEKLAILSDESLRQIGSYNPTKHSNWQQEINKINVGSRSLYDLGDAAFYHEFPEQRHQKVLSRPFKQIRYGFINDKFHDIIGGKAYEKITFDPGETNKKVSGSLESGTGKVFTAHLSKDQNLEINLEADPQVLLSIYSPSGKNPLLENSPKRSLSQKLPESGFYEFVVVSNAAQSSDYQLNVTAENPAPIPSPTATITPTQTPLPTPIETIPNQPLKSPG